MEDGCKIDVQAETTNEKKRGKWKKKRIKGKWMKKEEKIEGKWKERCEIKEMADIKKWKYM